jgi:hypothetical protein
MDARDSRLGTGRVISDAALAHEMLSRESRFRTAAAGGMGVRPGHRSRAEGPVDIITITLLVLAILALGGWGYG